MKKLSTPIKHHHSRSEHQLPTKERLFPLHRSITEDDHYNQDHSSPITKFVRKLLGLSRPARPKPCHKSRSTTSITRSSVISSYQPDKSSKIEHCSIEPRKPTTIKIVTPNECTLSTFVMDWDRQSLPDSSLIRGEDDHCSTTTTSSCLANSVVTSDNSSLSDALSDTNKPSSAAIDALVNVNLSHTKRNDEFENMPKINLFGRGHDTAPVMTESIADMIRPYIPRRFRIAQNWNLLYSLDQHGTSLATIYSLMRDVDDPCMMIIKDADEQIFGAYLSNPLIQQSHYYGTGECFLWKLASQQKQQAMPKVKAFSWTGKNDYMILSGTNFIAIGGGDGKFGLWINSELHDGYSDTCPTFDNEILSLKPEFKCMEMEIWGLCL
ncbi:TLD-domain-containing protein [Gilbertella persicaria]|uniref:TLD-domain-containing protein n=1 Tax=Gilbertella persicaria TaxID=101096 RepID=UPI002221236E|nr:TLD-domain-containing protein [Gilbertella persicaria]KAI8047372.1 TLD-domain-containing protein [Gilbertella persicaria]